MTPRLLAACAAVAGLVGCAEVPVPGSPKVALSAPGAEAGTRAIVLDDAQFLGPDWEPRIVEGTLVVEPAGACRLTSFPGLEPLYRGSGWKPDTSCTAVSFWRHADAFANPEQCDAELERADAAGAWRFASAWMERATLGGRPARHYVFEIRAAGASFSGHEYDVCWGTTRTTLLVYGPSAQAADVDRIQARLVRSFRWDAPVPEVRPASSR
jgi:hypothetical protein